MIENEKQNETKQELTGAEREKMLYEFWDTMQKYRPNWQNLINNRIALDKYKPKGTKPEEKEAYKMCKAFSERMKKIRFASGLTMEEMGERIEYSRQYISKIEKNEINSIPIKKLDLISYLFSTSVAYLLGLIDDSETDGYSTEVVSKEEYYFFEYPEEHYFDPIKDGVIPPRRGFSPMMTFGPSVDEIKKDICDKMGDDYELMFALREILSSSRGRRDKAIKLIKDIHNLVVTTW